MKDLFFIGGAMLVIAAFGASNMAINLHSEKRDLEQKIQQLETENRDLTNRLIGTLSN